MKKYGLDAAALIGAAESMLDARFHISADELETVDFAPLNHAAKAEDL